MSHFVSAKKTFGRQVELVGLINLCIGEFIPLVTEIPGVIVFRHQAVSPVHIRKHNPGAFFKAIGISMEGVSVKWIYQFNHHKYIMLGVIKIRFRPFRCVKRNRAGAVTLQKRILSCECLSIPS